ncbi:MAG: hypothetical protein ACRD26_23330 [Vicinamibacterales bacterium]
MRALTQFLPTSLKHGISSQLARLESSRLARELATLASGRGPIVAGPWLGEVGFELLYWVPFLAWFTERFSVDRSRLTALSRGGTRSWYEPFAGGYGDVLDYVTPEAFKAHHDARVREIGEQKQTRLTGLERELLAIFTAAAGVAGAPLVHPSLMYRVLRPFWWGHLGPAWVQRHARYRALPRPAREELPRLPPSYVAVKFYFNDCFPASAANRALVRNLVADLSARGPVVSLSIGIDLDDHGGCHVDGHGVLDLAGATPPSRNLHVQSAVVAHASAFAGTYGGFAYLAPFYGVPCTAYYSDPRGFSRSHLTMARTALASLGTPDLLDVRAIRDPQSAIVDPQPAIPDPHSAVRDPRSAIGDPRSAIRGPESAIRDPQSWIDDPRFKQHD